MGSILRALLDYRLGSIGLIIAAVLLLMAAFGLSVAMSSIHHLVVSALPFSNGVATDLGFYRLAPALAIFITFYILFLALTPARYCGIDCRKWPGALLVTAWWVATVELLPNAISLFGGYSLTFGSLAGVMVALLFFFCHRPWRGDGRGAQCGAGGLRRPRG